MSLSGYPISGVPISSTPTVVVTSGAAAQVAYQQWYQAAPVVAQ